MEEQNKKVFDFAIRLAQFSVWCEDANKDEMNDLYETQDQFKEEFKELMEG